MWTLAPENPEMMQCITYAQHSYTRVCIVNICANTKSFAQMLFMRSYECTFIREYIGIIAYGLCL